VREPRIPPHVAEVIRHLPPEIKRQVRSVVRALSVPPDEGEPLRYELEGFWKYRVKRFRIIYAIDRDRRRLNVVAVGHRRTVYDEVLARVRGRSRSRPRSRS